MPFDELEFLKENGLVADPTSDPAPNPDSDPTPEPAPAPAADPASAADPAPVPTPQISREQIEQELAKNLFGADSLQSVSKQYGDLKSRVGTYEDLLKKNSNPFADDTVKKFNSFVKNTNVKDFSVFNRLSNFDDKQTSALDAMVLAKVMKDPERLAPLEAQIRSRILSSYDVESEEELNQDDVKKNSLLIDSVDSISEIKKFQETAFSSAGSEEDFDPESYFAEKQQKQEQTKEAWKPFIDKMLENKKFALPKVTEKDLDVSLDLSDEQVENLRKTAESIALSVGDLNEDNVKNVFGAVYATAVGYNIETVLKRYHDAVSALTEEERDKFFSNAKPVSRTTGKPEEPGQQKDTHQSIMEIEGFA